MSVRRLGLLLPAVLLVFIATGCGGGGGGGGDSNSGGGNSNPPPPPPPASSTAVTSLKMTSDPGDFVGDGRSYTYSQSTADFTVVVQGGLLVVEVRGDERWRGEFQMPNGYSTLVTGTFNNLARYPLHDPVIGGLNWVSNGRTCAGVNGTVTIRKATYVANELTELEMQYTQYCDGTSFALRGDLRWNAKDTTTPPGPTSPPAGLWQPPSGVTPASGTYVYLESQPDDYIGAGATYLYTQANAIFATGAGTGNVRVRLAGDEDWDGTFQGMSTLSRLEPGYYGNLRGYPFHNPAVGGLDWSGASRTCGGSVGWFVVDSVTYSGGALVGVDIRFEQRCVYRTGVLRGKIHWDANNFSEAPGPITPPPNLWQPAPGATPATGNYVYFEVPTGNFAQSGQSFLYTQANSVLSVRTRVAGMAMEIVGDHSWTGEFQGMSALGELEVGYYGNVQRYPVHNPTVGGISWQGGTLLCGAGWFVVDAVVYEGDVLKSIDLRFEQNCGSATSLLRGKIHWSADDTTVAPGPVTPPPGLWEPAPGATPASGNYAYFESLIIASGGPPRKYLYTPDNAALFVDAGAALVTVRVNGDGRWSGELQGMNSLSQLVVGYYGDLRGYPLPNPAKGGISWSSTVASNCGGPTTGWFVVDAVTYDGSTMTSIEVRFELRCTNGTSVLNGKLRWSQ